MSTTSEANPPAVVATASESTMSTITSTTPAVKAKKPSNSRVIIEVDALHKNFGRHLKDCPECDAKLKLSLPSCCIATAIKLECTNELCTHIDIERPAPADVPLLPDAGSPLKERMTDCALNVLHVLSFMASGDGGSEAERLLGLLGLPNATTMNKRSFGIMQQRIAPVVAELTDTVLLENLNKEVRLHYDNRFDDDGISLFTKWQDGRLTDNPEKWPLLTASTDMAWQQRACGKQHNSCSGHCLFVGQLTRKPISKQIYSRSCSMCKAFYRKHEVTDQVPPHDCVKNYDGSSGSMEPMAALDMYTSLYDRQSVVVARIITDDDSTIKAKLKYTNNTWMEKNNTTIKPKIINSNGNEVIRPDHGEIPGHMPEPSFDADPNHRKKLVGKVLWGLAKKNVGEKKTMTKCDAMRLQRYYSFMARQLKHKTTDEEMLKSGQAVLEHHFDNHECCGDWCIRKDQTDEEKKEKKKFYRCKVEDIDLYDYLKNVLARFTTLQALKEMSHGYDTLVNESLNNSIAWLAPKNKVHASTASLATRIGIALCINTLGTMAFYSRIFQMLGITMNDDVRYYIQQINDARDKKNAVSKTKKAKVKRSEKFHTKLQQQSSLAKKERRKRRGAQYKTGIGMTGGYDSDDTDTQQPPQPPPKKKRAKVRCPHCQKYGHKTTKSKYCDKNTNNVQAAEQPTGMQVTQQQQHAAEDAREIEDLDAIGFDNDSDVVGFFSADEFSDDTDCMDNQFGDL